MRISSLLTVNRFRVHTVIIALPGYIDCMGNCKFYLVRAGVALTAFNAFGAACTARPKALSDITSSTMTFVSGDDVRLQPVIVLPLLGCKRLVLLRKVLGRPHAFDSE